MTVRTSGVRRFLRALVGSASPQSLHLGARVWMGTSLQVPHCRHFNTSRCRVRSVSDILVTTKVLCHTNLRRKARCRSHTAGISTPLAADRICVRHSHDDNGVMSPVRDQKFCTALELSTGRKVPYASAHMICIYYSVSLLHFWAEP